jgi:hypothetical protein
MTESPEQTATPQADSTGRGDELVAAAVVLAFFSFAGLAAVGVLLFGRVRAAGRRARRHRGGENQERQDQAGKWRHRGHGWRRATARSVNARERNWNLLSE